jgi:hypothetical protein
MSGRDPIGPQVYSAPGINPRLRVPPAGGATHQTMNDSNQIKTELSALALYLASRRDQILRAWLRAVELDPQLTAPASISRAQFNDHIPQVLDAFERRLQAQDAEDKAL